MIITNETKLHQIVLMLENAQCRFMPAKYGRKNVMLVLDASNVWMQKARRGYWEDMFIVRLTAMGNVTVGEALASVAAKREKWIANNAEVIHL